MKWESQDNIPKYSKWLSLEAEWIKTEFYFQFYAFLDFFKLSTINL